MNKDIMKQTILGVITAIVIATIIIVPFSWMGREQYNEYYDGAEKEVAWTELNVRDGAGTEGTTVLATLKKWDNVTLTGRYRETNIGQPREYRWVEITYKDLVGWVCYDGLDY